MAGLLAVYFCHVGLHADLAAQFMLLLSGCREKVTVRRVPDRVQGVLEMVVMKYAYLRKFFCSFEIICLIVCSLLNASICLENLDYNCFGLS